MSRTRYTTARRPRRTVSSLIPVHRVADTRRARYARALLAGLDRVRRATSAEDAYRLVVGHEDPRTVIPWGLALDVTPPDGVVLKADNLTDVTASLYENGWKVGGNISGYLTLPAPDAVTQWAQEQSARMVSGVTQATRDAIQVVIANGFTNGRPPMETATILRSTVGLNPNQALAVANYRQGLVDVASGARTDTSVLDAYALHDGRYGLGGLTQDKIDTLTSRYAERQLAARADQIAHTETMRAANAGVQANWRDAAANGLIDATSQGQQWIVTDDDKLCPECMELEDEVVSIYDTFSTGDDGPPLHPDCRCVLGLVGLGSEAG